MRKEPDKRKPNKRDEQDVRRQREALRDIKRAIELTMNSDVGGRITYRLNKNQNSNQGRGR
ncbi:MAG: hypothetical protein QNI91_12575 [Arenicellales bacterium]|nr:hypothetical protein [Arenicellales bacterium]